MKTNATRRTLSCLTLVAALLAALPAAAADLSATLAGLARYESGGDVRPLREIERFVGQSANNVQLRADLEAGLAGLLTGDATFEARRFACQNLAVIGDAASVPALAGLLGRDETVGIAAAALAQNPSDQAGAALRTALSSVTGRARAQLAFALGTRRDPEAVEMLTRLAADGDLGVAEAAIVALGKIANEPAQGALSALRKQSSAALTRAVAEASFTLADALVRKGDQTAAAAIYRELVTPGNPADIRRGALGGLLRTDADGGEQRMLEVLGGTDAALKPVAIAALPELKSSGASKVFAGVLPKLDPGEQFLLVQALALRGDGDAREAIAQQLESPHELVRSAAIESLGHAGDASTVPVLARATLAAKNPAELKAVEFALASLKGGEAVDQALAAQLRNRMAGPKAPFLAALVRRANPVSSRVFLAETASTDPAMARLAFQGLSRTATAEQLPAVLAALGGLKAKAALDDAQASVGQLLKRVGSPSMNAAAIRGALAKASGADAQTALLPMLAICPDAEGLDQVEAAANDPNPATRDLGLRTLADWPDAAAWGPLTALYAKAPSGTERVLVMRGLARLLGEQNAQPDAQLISRYRETLARAVTYSDLKLLLGALAGCSHPDALKLAVEQLANPAVRPEATLAVKKIAENIRAQHPQAADDALKQLR